MSSKIEIRSAETGDLDRLIALYRHLHPTDEELPDGPGRDHLWTAMRARSGFRCVVGFHGDVLVASCCLAVIPNLTRGGRPYGLIENVVTHADFRRRGFGTAVVAYALDRAWQQDCYKVMLLTGSTRPETHRFYHACGFRSGEKTGFVARPHARVSRDGPSVVESRRALANTIAARSRLHGEFRLRSGAQSTEYFDKYQFESDPALLRAIAEQLANMVPPGTEMLAGLELGGVPIATALSLQTGLPVVFVRKAAKGYGTCRLAEGADVRGRRLLARRPGTLRHRSRCRRSGSLERRGRAAGVPVSTAGPGVGEADSCRRILAMLNTDSGEGERRFRHGEQRIRGC
jgi:GNAT superfamily N-acetyltransferase